MNLQFFLCVLRKWEKKLKNDKETEFYILYLTKYVDSYNIIKISKLIKKLERKYIDKYKVKKIIKKMFKKISELPKFVDIVMKDLNIILEQLQRYDFTANPEPITDVPIQIAVFTMNPQLESNIKQVMQKPSEKLSENDTRVYNKRLLICNDEGFPVYMKSGYPSQDYNTQVVVTQIDQIIESPDKTLFVEDSIFIRSNFIVSNPPSFNDIPESQIQENPFSTKKEIMDSIINSFGYSIRESLRRNVAYYVTRKFTNSKGYVYIVRLSYH